MTALQKREEFLSKHLNTKKYFKNLIFNRLSL